MPALRYPGSEVAVVGYFPAQSVIGTTTASGRVKLGPFHSYGIYITVGQNGSNLDAKVVQYDAASGGNSKDLPGAAITQLTSGDDNEVVVIEFDGEQFDTANGYFWFALSVTTSSASFVGAIFLGCYPRGGEATDNQTTDVIERLVI